MKTDLVEHAAEVDETAGFRVATAESWNVGHAVKQALASVSASVNPLS
jgi:hypothetical protein